MKKKLTTDNTDKPLTSDEFSSMNWSYGLDGLANILGEEAVAPLRKRGRPLKAVKKVPVYLRIDPEVLAYFRATGKGWQTRMDAALKEWMDARAS